MLIGMLLSACAARPGGAQESEARSEEVEPAVSLSSLFIDPAEAARVVESGALLLDARPLRHFILSHAEGAVHVRWDEFSDPEERGRLHPDTDVLGELLGALGVSNHRRVVVIGGWDGEWGEEARIVWMLRYLGLEQVAIVEGGHSAWRNADLPTESGRSRPTAATFTPVIVPSVSAQVSHLEEFGLVLDVRTRDEFEGATPYGEARGGHVPGARHLLWTDLIDANGALRTPEEIREIVGEELDVPVVAYCTGGVRSAFVWAALEHAGYTNAANYAGSWWEYAGTELPVE